MRLSKNFELEEFLVSQTAERHGIDMTPPDEVVENLARLCRKVLQPLRDRLASPVMVSSGYRPELLNRLIGGSPRSAHIDGRAADFNVAGYTPHEVVSELILMNPPFDQVIHEFGRWVHVGIAARPRKEVLTAYHHEGATHYRFGLHAIEEVRHA